MKERKRYETPDIKVISIRENSDIIQTSGLGALTNIQNAGSSARSILYSSGNINTLFTPPSGN